MLGSPKGDAAPLCPVEVAVADTLSSASDKEDNEGSERLSQCDDVDDQMGDYKDERTFQKVKHTRWEEVRIRKMTGPKKEAKPLKEHFQSLACQNNSEMEAMVDMEFIEVTQVTHAKSKGAG